MKISSFEDLAKYFGETEPNEGLISRSLYRRTNCGAWLEFVRTKTKKQKLYFHAMLDPRPDGTVRVFSIKAGGAWNKEPRQWISIDMAPKLSAWPEIRGFLSLPDETGNNTIQGITWKEIRDQKSDTFTLHPRSTVISFYVEQETQVEAKGISIGTIVEGADAQPESSVLYFPFDSQVLEDEIQRLEDEAQEIWVEWNEPVDES